jgi:hypothetical protein
MGLIKETNAQYYAGEQIYAGTAVNPQSLVWPAGMTPLIWDATATPTSIPNFKIYIDNVETLPANYTLATTIVDGVRTQTITLNLAVAITSVISVRLIQQSIWDNYRSYAYTTLTDVVNNFMVAYVGLDKIIPRVKRSDVIFFAKRGLQEFSYDTLKSINSQELTIPPSLSVIMPQDYINYVQMSWVDQSGVKHIIYPTRLTSDPTQPLLQDDQGVPTQDGYGNNLEAAQAQIRERWNANNNLNITGQYTNEIFNNADVYDWSWWKMAYGQRYGLEPETSNKNGWFTINEREGKFSFSSALANKLIVLEYISDGLAYDMNSKIPKMAEEALYMHIAYSILAGRSNVQEYIVQRFKKDRKAQLRNAKIRLSNIKLEEFTQVMRGKSKWIKH